MTIEKIEYTSERIKEKRKKKEENQKEKTDLKLIESFNKKAKEISSPYRIFNSMGFLHLFLLKKWFIFEYKEELNQIYYSKSEDEFSFIRGLDEHRFRAIEPILNNIDVKFKVELKSGKIPTKYKIIDNL